MVAQEVENLAQMSGNAATEISGLLEGSLVKVQSSILTAGLCKEVLDEVAGNAGSVASMAAEIASASQQQSERINETSGALNELEVATKESGETSHHVSNLVEDLHSEVAHLRAAVDRFNETFQGQLGDQKTLKRPIAGNFRFFGPK